MINWTKHIAIKDLTIKLNSIKLELEKHNYDYKNYSCFKFLGMIDKKECEIIDKLLERKYTLEIKLHSIQHPTHIIFRSI